MSRHKYSRNEDARYDLVSSIPNWMRACDGVATLVVGLILFAGLFSYGYVTDPLARGIAYAGCALLGFWSVVGACWGRWSGADKAPARWVMVLFAVALVWTGFQLVPLPRDFVVSVSPVWAMTMDAYREAGLAIPDKLTLSQSPGNGLRSWHQLFASACFFAGICMLASRRTSSIHLIVILVVMCLIEGYLGIITFVFREAHRAYGGIYNPNQHATMIMMGMPLYFGALAVWGRLSPRFHGSVLSGSNPLMFFYAAGLVALVGWMASMSRGAILIGAVVLAAWVCIELLLYFREDSDGGLAPGALRMILGTGAVMAVAVLLVFLMLESISLPAGVTDRGISAVDIAEHGAGRIELWRATLEAAAESPWTGLGLTGTEAALTRFLMMPTIKTPVWSHNDFVQAVAELGIPVTILMLAVLVFFARSTLMRFRARSRIFDSSERLLARATLAGVLVVVIHEAVDFPLRIPLIGFLFLVLLGLALNQGPLLITSMRPRMR